MQGDRAVEMRRETIDRAFVTSLIIGLVFVLFEWGALGGSSSLSVVCSCFCEMNGLASHHLGFYPRLTKFMEGDKALNVKRAYILYMCLGVFWKKQTCLLSQAMMSSKSTRCEVYLRSEEGKGGAPLAARCLNIPTHPPPLSLHAVQICLAGTGMSSAFVAVKSTAVSKEMIHS